MLTVCMFQYVCEELPGRTTSCHSQCCEEGFLQSLHSTKAFIKKQINPILISMTYTLIAIKYDAIKCSTLYSEITPLYFLLTDYLCIEFLCNYLCFGILHKHTHLESKRYQNWKVVFTPSLTPISVVP